MKRIHHRWRTVRVLLATRILPVLYNLGLSQAVAQVECISAQYSASAFVSFGMANGDFDRFSDNANSSDCGAGAGASKTGHSTPGVPCYPDGPLRTGSGGAVGSCGGSIGPGGGALYASGAASVAPNFLNSSIGGGCDVAAIQASGGGFAQVQIRATERVRFVVQLSGVGNSYRDGVPTPISEENYYEGYLEAGSTISVGVNAGESSSTIPRTDTGQVDLERSASALLRISITPAPRGPSALLRAVELTQSVQDWFNHVPLVKGKRTFARVFFQAETPAEVNRLFTPRLRGFRNGVQLPGSPLASFNLSPQISLPLNAEPGRGDPVFRRSGVAHFELPESWTQGTIELRPDAEDATIKGVAPGFGSPASLTVPCTFISVPQPRVAVIPLTVLGLTGLVSAPDMTTIAHTLLQTRRMFPADQLDWILVEAMAVGLPDDSSLNDIVSGIRSGQRFNSTLNGQNYALMGVLRREALPSNAGLFGIGNANARIGWAVVGDPSDPSVFAHELGHVYDRPHPARESLGEVVEYGFLESLLVKPGSCGERAALWQEDFPYFHMVACSQDSENIQELRSTLGPMDFGEPRKIYGFMREANGSARLIAPDCSAELMGYCNRRQQWPSDWTYQHLLNKFVELYNPASGNPAAPALAQLAASAAGALQPRAIVHGVVNLANGSVRWQPVHGLPPTGATAPATPGDFHLKLLDQGGAVLNDIPFHPEIPEDSISPTNVPAFFTLTPDWDPAVRRLALYHNANQLAVIASSENAPTVQVLVPNGGETLGANGMQIQWQAADADGDPLTFLVLYSPDGGTNWRTLASEWTKTNLFVKYGDLTGSTQAVVRVQVSDGFNFGADQSDAVFTVPDTTPYLVLAEPASNSVVCGSQSLVAEALTIDREDGVLPGANIEWYSDRDGFLGTNSLLMYPSRQLAEGNHLLTCIARDKAGSMVQTSVPIRVERHCPPTLEVLGPPAGGLFPAKIHGTMDAQVTVEMSTDLTAWMTVTSFLARSFSTPLTLPAVLPETNRFYRARVGPALPQAPSFLAHPTNFTGSNGASFVLEAPGAGTAPITYQWYLNDAPLIGQTNALYFAINVGAFYSGAYYCVASNLAGASTSTVATVTIAGGGYHVLHQFRTNNLGGMSGWGTLALDTNGWLYGCTVNGGISNAGTIFKLKNTGGSFTILHRFSATNDGATPRGGIIEGTDGLLYGTCSLGGSNNAGTIFRLTKDGTGFTVLRHLLSSGDCRNPFSELLEAGDGRLYGTAYNGGGFGRGGLFSLAKDGTDYQMIYGFKTTGFDGLGPIGGLIEAIDGMLYGTTELGGVSNRGTIFRIARDGEATQRSRISVSSWGDRNGRRAGCCRGATVGSTARPTPAGPRASERSSAWQPTVRESPRSRALGSMQPTGRNRAPV